MALDEKRLHPKGLTRSQIITVWAGLVGSAIGCSAWMLAMAGMGGDWMAFWLTVSVDLAMVILFGKLSLLHPSKRFALLALFLVLITAHCLAMYWWRYELWRGSAAVTPVELFREKKFVTMTIVAMICIVLAQFVVVSFLQANSRKNREKLRNKL